MKSLIASITILGLVGMVVGVVAQGATEASVGATVTIQNVSVAISDGTVLYGTLAVNTSKATTKTPELDDTQVAINNGNVTEDFLIRGQDSTSAGAGWTLAGAAASETYVHEFCTAGGGSPDLCDATPTYTELTTSNQNLTTSVATSGTQRFDLKITTPTATTDLNEQTVNVTVVAIAS